MFISCKERRTLFGWIFDILIFGHMTAMVVVIPTKLCALTYEKLSKSFKNPLALVHLILLSSKETIDLRYALTFTANYYAVGQRVSAFVYLGSLMECSGQKGLGRPKSDYQMMS